MKYFYNLLDGFKEPDRFYDEQTIRRFRVYPATPEIEKEAYENPHSDLWPVHDIHNSSTEPVDCKDIDEAYPFWNQKTLPFMNMFMIFKPKRA